MPLLELSINNTKSDQYKYLPPSLLKDGVSPHLADHQISQLYDQNGHKQGGVAHVLPGLTWVIHLKQQWLIYELLRFDAVFSIGFDMYWT